MIYMRKETRVFKDFNRFCKEENLQFKMIRSKEEIEIIATIPLDPKTIIMYVNDILIKLRYPGFEAFLRSGKIYLGERVIYDTN